MMRSLAEAKLRWEDTVKQTPTLAQLQQAVKSNMPDGLDSPCVSGCRSVCWKVSLLFRDAPAAQWSHILRESRSSYSSACAQHLRFIKHPEQLAALEFDPLADDPESPWDAVRRDELVRAEILQDVSRLPDEPFYHQEHIQTMILDILFLYGKLNPGVGGYRQGMHELLAPIVYVVAQDAVDRAAIATDDSADPTMVDVLDSYFIEHDAYALFSSIMSRASAFYEIGPDSESPSQERSTIVDKSKQIHEVTLMKIDHELATHLKNIEVLPQIFLIRWVRLLFGREFPFEQLLLLWDAIFAFDPNLDLIDFICVAMLLRVRWTLLEADYSVALQLLLKYPVPPPPNGPHTFVDDAIYLRNHPTAAGGITLIHKYTGKSPIPPPTNRSSRSSSSSRPVTPSFQGFGSLRQRTLGAKSPLSTSARLLQQPGGVEALLQGAAKGVIERGEKLGINQAVRDAMGEFKRNVQGLQEVRSPLRSRDSSGDNRPASSDHSVTVRMMERRNHQLAGMLDETIAGLKLLAASRLEGDNEQNRAAVEIAAAKIQFVKTFLENSSLSLSDDDDLPALGTLSISKQNEIKSPTVALDTTPVVMVSSAIDETRSVLSPPKLKVVLASTEEEGPQPEEAVEEVDKMDTDIPERSQTPSPTSNQAVAIPSESTTAPPAETEPQATNTLKVRPQGPIPTRSTLAQSSFSWMLEPDTTLSSSSSHTAPFSTSRPSSGGNSMSGQKRRSNNASRDRNAFLFGEVTSEGGHGERRLSVDQIFGLEPIRKVK
ncbi:rab-GTPase-TBC domain-containing protein [Podospora appendiculata]|uniref:Rab-GTPase-TBC domain-containing protein n=1 Tax=Podospora appendiculata TaxID=314037 RepID=A0AAE1CF91_9PEZI|nr:rab-GTPase-TBC domain-containing protein [Podospora appendiculata]